MSGHLARSGVLESSLVLEVVLHSLAKVLGSCVVMFTSIKTFQFCSSGILSILRHFEG